MNNKCKLNVILAVEAGAKAKSEGFTKVYQALEKPGALDGFSREYSPNVDTDPTYPGETQIVQLRVADAIETAKHSISDLFNVAATKEWGNMGAVANVVVDGTVLLTQVPVTYLLFLEKKLVDLMTFVKKLPTTDPAISWTWNSDKALWVSATTKVSKTKKFAVVITKAPATIEHPAQAEIVYEDKPEGVWSLTKYSGAASIAQVRELVNKVETLQNAVKKAREEANSVEVEQKFVADVVLDYIFGK